MSDRNVVDVTLCTFGLNEISPFVLRNLKTPETLSAQRRLLRKWDLRSKSLHAFCSQDPEITKAWQLDQISKLVDFAYSNHPFYHKLYFDAGFRKGDIVEWNDYYSLPIIDKPKIAANFDLFINPCLSAISEPYYTSVTSGSSGRILTAMFDQAMIDEDILRCMRFYEQMLGRQRSPSEWLYQIYVAAPPFSTLDGKFPTFTTSNECPAETLIKHLQALKPTIISGLPSYLLRLGELAKNQASLGIQAISTNSETSTVAEREKIAVLFGCPVFDEYSSVELGLIATQCSQGRYHITEDNVRVDVEYVDDLGFGQIVTTSLINSFMPFIRYSQGDIIQIQADHIFCSCGSTFRFLDSFLGRTDQNLQSSTIGNIPSDRVMALYDRTLLAPEANIAEFQIVQHEIDTIELFAVPCKKSVGIKSAVLELFCTELKALFACDSLDIRYTELEALPPEKSYKRRLIKNNIKS